MKPFKQMTVIGVGLLGASLALACKHRGLVDRVVGFGRHPEKLQKAGQAGIIDSGSTDLKTAVEDADLIVLCVPVSSLVARVREMLAWVQPGCLVTDVGSVKHPVVQELDALMPDGIHYVGSHPIAGGEKSGWQAAHKDLYQGARCIVTPTDKTHAPALQQIMEFWQRLDMQVETLSAEEHDYIYGVVSHLPHVVAFALMNTVAEGKTENRGEILSMCGAGLRDITRIASSHPAMWRDICMQNKENVLLWVDRFQKNLQSIQTMIQNEQWDTLLETFDSANAHREKLVGSNK